MLKWNLLTMVLAMTVGQQSLASSWEDFLQEMDAASDITEIIDKKYSKKCDNFVGNGEVRKWGTIIEKEFDKEKYQSLYQAPSDVHQLCPMYSRLNDEDKKGLWILIITAMTHYESSCVFTETAPGPNGTAAGLLQLHKGKEANYSRGCRNGDSATAERSLTCGISMLNDQIEQGRPLFSPNSYWEVLRPKGRSKKARKIMEVIGQYPACTTGKSSDTPPVTAKNTDPKIKK